MIYKISFTPAQPYFFGNERSFQFPGQNVGGEYANSYFIRSEDIPSQSTILGTLRYLMMPCIRENYNYTLDEKVKNEQVVGKLSFSPDRKDASFGIIQEISPIFLEDENGERLIPCPFNAGPKPEDTSQNSEGNQNCKKWEYYPFNKFGRINTADGEKLYFEDYDSKEGLADGFLRLSDQVIISRSQLIHGCERVGINRFRNENGFFRKEYKNLEKGYSFCIYVDLDIPENDERLKRKIVTMGQGKSPFSVCFRKEDSGMTDFYSHIEQVLKEANVKFLEDANAKLTKSLSIVYCLGDAFTDVDPSDVSLFAAYRTKEYRAFETSFDNKTKKVVKGERLYRLFKAGSIFITDCQSDNKEADVITFNNSSVKIAGYNKFIVIGGMKNNGC